MTFFPLEQVDRVEGNSVPAVFVPRLVKLWERRRFPVERMMTHYEFDQINEAAHAAEEGRVIEPVRRMHGDA